MCVRLCLSGFALYRPQIVLHGPLELDLRDSTLCIHMCCSLCCIRQEESMASLCNTEISSIAPLFSRVVSSKGRCVDLSVYQTMALLVGSCAVFACSVPPPVPMFNVQSLEVQTVLSLLVSLLVTIPLCYAPAAFVTFLVRERACKSKRVRQDKNNSRMFVLMLFVCLCVCFLFMKNSSSFVYGRNASMRYLGSCDAAAASD